MTIGQRIPAIVIKVAVYYGYRNLFYELNLEFI